MNDEPFDPFTVGKLRADLREILDIQAQVSEIRKRVEAMAHLETRLEGYERLQKMFRELTGEAPL
jgi:hypothetical protein